MTYAKKIKQDKYKMMYVDKAQDRAGTDTPVCTSRYQSFIEKDYRFVASMLDFLTLDSHLGLATGKSNLPSLA